MPAKPHRCRYCQCGVPKPKGVGLLAAPLSGAYMVLECPTCGWETKRPLPTDLKPTDVNDKGEIPDA